ncbi:MAG: cytochrome c [Bryobacteraceae bacterium]
MRWKRAILLLPVCALAHDPISTKITWSREVSRLVLAHCASCHREGGSSFSLMTYRQARPWAVAIKEEILERRMPPWGAVDGFGDFRNDEALTEAELEIVAAWAEGGAPEGDPALLPPVLDFTKTAAPASPPCARKPAVRSGARGERPARIEARDSTCGHSSRTSPRRRIFAGSCSATRRWRGAAPLALQLPAAFRAKLRLPRASFFPRWDSSGSVADERGHGGVDSSSAMMHRSIG